MSTVRINQAIARASDAGISAATLSHLCQMKPSVLSNYARGVRTAHGDTVALIVNTSLLLASVAEAVKPLSLPNDAVSLSALINFVRDHNIAPEQIRDALSSVFGVAETNDVDVAVNG